MPVEPKKRKLFGRGNGILTSESSLGESGFLEKSGKPTVGLVFFIERLSHFCAS